jgi:hypothetical protein
MSATSPARLGTGCAHRPAMRGLASPLVCTLAFTSTGAVAPSVLQPPAVLKEGDQGILSSISAAVSVIPAGDWRSRPTRPYTWRPGRTMIERTRLSPSLDDPTPPGPQR